MRRLQEGAARGIVRAGGGLLLLLLTACSAGVTEREGSLRVVEAEVTSGPDTALVVGMDHPETGERLGEVRWEALEYRVVLRNDGAAPLEGLEVRLLPSDAIRDLYGGDDPFARESGRRSSYGVLPATFRVAPGGELEIRRSITTFAHETAYARNVESPLTPEQHDRLLEVAGQVTLEVRWDGGSQRFGPEELSVRIAAPGQEASPPAPGANDGPTLPATRGSGTVPRPHAATAVPLVGAYHYLWYGKPGQWEQAATHTPVLGRYDSRDPEVVRHQARWARRAGLDFLAAGWPGPGTFEEEALQALLAEPGGVPVAVHYESALALDVAPGEPIDFAAEVAPGVTRGQRFLAHMEHLAEHVLVHPRAFRVDGRPVVVLYLVRDWRNYGPYLAELRERLAARGLTPYLVADVLWWADPAHLDWRALARHFDAVTGYNLYDADHPEAMADYVARARDLSERYRRYAESFDLAFVPSVLVGYDDRELRGRDRPVLPREEGAFLRRSWAVAQESLDPDVPLVLVTTFNEWHEGTELEPSAEHGTAYLDLLREVLEGPGPILAVDRETYAGNLERAAAYLASRFDPHLRLVPESSSDGAWQVEGRTVSMDRVYWLQNDNRLAALALRPYAPVTAQAIADELARRGVTGNQRFEVLEGTPIPTEPVFQRPRTVELTEGYAILDEEPAGPAPDYHRYADLLCLQAINHRLRGEPGVARALVRQVASMWDGTGLRDGPAGQDGVYATYKLALFLIALQVTGEPFEHVAEVERALWSAQAAGGGLHTGILPDGRPEGLQNTETTALVLLAYDPDLVRRLRGRGAPLLP